MQSLQSSLEQQYSNSNLTKLNNSNSTVDLSTVFSNLSDVIPSDDYMPFYISAYNKLGYDRFLYLANSARKGGKDPKRLFFWMLKHNEMVK